MLSETGYPFNKGMEPRKIEKKQKDETPEEIKQRERAEIMAQLHPKPETAGEFARSIPRKADGPLLCEHLHVILQRS